MQKSERKTGLSGGVAFSFITLLAGTIGSSEVFWKKLLESTSGNLDSGFWSMGLASGSMLVAGWSLLYLLLKIPLIGQHQQRIYWLSGSMIFIVYFMTAERRVFDAPIWDDYNALLEWFIPVKNGEKPLIDSLLSPYWECKTTVPRILSVILEFFTGKWFIHVQKYVNGFLLIALALLFSRSFKTKESRVSVFVGSLILLFNFQHFHTVLCAYSGSTYYLLVIFALASFMAVKSDHPKAVQVAVTSATLAVWTFGNGWLVFPLLLLETSLTARWKSFFLIAAAMAANAIVYFVGYQPEHLNRIDTFSMPLMVEYTAIFLGNSFQYLYSPFYPKLVSFLILSVVIFLSIKSIREKKAPSAFYHMLLFLIGSAMMAAIFRHQSGVFQAFSVRYGFFSVTAFWCAILALADEKKAEVSTRFRTALIGTAAVLTLSKAVFFYPEMAVAQEEHREMLTDWKRNGTEIEKNTPFHQRGIGLIMKESENRGIWRVSASDTLPPNNSLFTIQYITRETRWRAH